MMLRGPSAHQLHEQGQVIEVLVDISIENGHGHRCEIADKIIIVEFIVIATRLLMPEAGSQF